MHSVCLRQIMYPHISALHAVVLQPPLADPLESVLRLGYELLGTDAYDRRWQQDFRKSATHIPHMTVLWKLGRTDHRGVMAQSPVV